MMGLLMIDSWSVHMSFDKKGGKLHASRHIPLGGAAGMRNGRGEGLGFSPRPAAAYSSRQGTATHIRHADRPPEAGMPIAQGWWAA